jgi:hypothetical protein
VPERSVGVGTGIGVGFDVVRLVGFGVGRGLESALGVRFGGDVGFVGLGVERTSGVKDGAVDSGTGNGA